MLFCFALDASAEEIFKQRVRNLHTCFPHNVLIADKELDTSRRGSINKLHSYLNCMEKLARPRHKWDRLITLENHDVPLMTYEELQQRQADEVTARKGKGDLEKLFRNDDLWVVE